MEQLIKDLEAASEGSQSLGDRVLLACGVNSDPTDLRPDPTVSMDAALELVPQGWDWSIKTISQWTTIGPDGYRCEIWKRDYSVTLRQPPRGRATPALALCVAVLRAHQHGAPKQTA